MITIRDRPTGGCRSLGGCARLGAILWSSTRGAAALGERGNNNSTTSKMIQHRRNETKQNLPWS